MDQNDDRSLPSICLSYEAPLCCTRNKAVKPIWSLFTTGQMMIHYMPSAASFGTLALHDGRHPPPLHTHTYHPHSFSPFPSLPFPSWGGPGVCGTITMAHKGKWVPCVWWRGAVAVTRYSHGGIPPKNPSLTLGGAGNGSLNCCLRLSVTFFRSLVSLSPESDLWAHNRFQQIPAISTWRSVEWGPLLPGLPPLFWCFGTLLRSDTTLRGAGQRFYCFQSVSAIRKELTFA